MSAHIIEPDFRVLTVVCFYQTSSLLEVLNNSPHSYSIYQLIADKLRGNLLGGWHYGGSLAMKENPVEPHDCLPSGEVLGLKNVFVIDASAFLASQVVQ